MRSLPELIATDLDGTLVRSDDTVSATPVRSWSGSRRPASTIVGRHRPRPRLTELVRLDIPAADFLVMGGGSRVLDIRDPDHPVVLRDERLAATPSPRS